jgi:cytochrome c-type biogenesis protein CcmH/NrfG
MKKETIITALVFLVVGLLFGYFWGVQAEWKRSQKAAQTANAGLPAAMPGASAPDAAPVGTMPGLPEGHPPIDSASLVKQLQEEAEQNPRDPEIPLKLANFLYDQRQFQQAIGWYEKSLSLNPNNVNARTDLGTAYFFVGQTAQALKEYGRSLALDPNHKPTLLNLVVVNLEGTHDLGAARQAWERLHNLDPSNSALEGLKQKLDAAQGSGRAPSTR